MDTIIPNSFTAYVLTDEEVLQGGVFTSLQKQVLHNHLATEAENRLRLELNPEKVQEFIQAEAELKGKIQLLQYLLDVSDASEEELKRVRNT